MTDQQALAQYASTKDAHAFRHIVSVYQGLVYSAARRRLQNSHDIDDVVQHTFIELANSSHKIREDLGSWLYTTPLHNAADLIRKDQSRRRHESLAPPPPRPTDSDPHAPFLTQEEWQTLSPKIDDAILALPPDQRTLIIQHFFQNKSQRDLAKSLNTTQPTIHRRLNTAIESIRQYLRAAGHLPAAPALIGTLHALSHSNVPAPLAAQLTKIGLAGTEPAKSLVLSKTGIFSLGTGKVSTASVSIVAAIALGAVALLGWAAHSSLNKSGSRTIPIPPAARVAPVPSYTVTASADFSREGVISIGYDLASDAAGNLYAVGQVDPAPGIHHGILRRKSSTSSSWTTLYDMPDATFHKILLDRQGDLWILGMGDPPHDSPLFSQEFGKPILIRRAAGQTALVGVQTGLPKGEFMSPDSDDAGNLYFEYYSYPGSDPTRFYRLPAAELTLQPITVPISTRSFSARMAFVSARPFPGLYLASLPMPGGNPSVLENGKWKTSPAPPTTPRWLIHRSLDCGATWDLMGHIDFPPQSSGFLFNQAFFADSLGTMYLSTRYEMQGPPYGSPDATSGAEVLYASADGGATWRTVSNALVCESTPRLSDFTALPLPGGKVLLASDRSKNLLGTIQVLASDTFSTLRAMPNTFYHGLALDNAGDVWVNESTGDIDTNMGWHVLCLTPTRPPSTAPAPSPSTATQKTGP